MTWLSTFSELCKKAWSLWIWMQCVWWRKSKQTQMCFSDLVDWPQAQALVRHQRREKKCKVCERACVSDKPSERRIWNPKADCCMWSERKGQSGDVKRWRKSLSFNHENFMTLNLDRLLVSARITAQRWAHINNWAQSLRISKYVDAEDQHRGTKTWKWWFKYSN